MEFNYKWNLSDLKKVKPNGYKVFSCFAGGGGSSQGYKMAGYDVIGCNEIDHRQMEIYKYNLKPKYSYLEDIRTFRLREDLPKQLFELDILDASFPCSLFSTANPKADAKKGKEVKFREGQVKQTLDDLAFEAIKLVDKIKPKICVFENVKGLLQEKNKWYVEQIYSQFDKIGYRICHHLINCADLGVPQNRRRVFFFAVRNDIFVPTADIFETEPLINLNIKENHVPFKDIESFDESPLFNNPSPSCKKGWDNALPGHKLYEDKKFTSYKIDPNKTLKTIASNSSKAREGALHYKDFRMLTQSEVYKAFSFPLDYECKDPYYVCGMCVPPLAMYRISKEIQIQWLDKL